MGNIDTDKKTVYTVQDGQKFVTTESHAGAERTVLRQKIREALHVNATDNQREEFVRLLDKVLDPERLLLLVHDYVNPWRCGGEDEPDTDGDDKWRPTFRFYDTPNQKDGRPFTLVEENRGNVYSDTLWRYRIDLYASPPGSVYIRESAPEEAE